MKYPQRAAFFANKYIRILTNTCAANQLGSNAMVLCMIIVMQEDAIRYRQGIYFHNGPLQLILGIARWESLDGAREKAVEAGWLHYENQGKRKPGLYWVTIPKEHQALLNVKGDNASDDGPKSEEDAESLPLVDSDSPESLPLTDSDNSDLLPLKNSDKQGHNSESLSLTDSDKTSDKDMPLSLKNSDNASDKDGFLSLKNSEPSSSYTYEREPVPVVSQKEPESEMLHVEHSSSLSLVEEKPKKLSIGKLGCIMSLEEHEIPTAEEICETFTAKYIVAAVQKIRARKERAGYGDLVWLSELCNYIREHPATKEERCA